MNLVENPKPTKRATRATRAAALAALALTAFTFLGPIGRAWAQPSASSAPTRTPVATAPSPAAVPSASAAAAPGPLVPIAHLDLARYMGRWYELARYPNRFQQQCMAAATATYSLQPEGGVQVINRCPTADGKVDEATGEARRIGPEGSATLQVRFAPAWLSFLPFVWGDYWVVELDADYQLSVVSEPQRDYLWVLSRQPSLPTAQWEALNARLKALGFDPARLVRVGGGGG